MNLEAIFSFVSLLALLGWVALAASPVMPVWSDRIAAWVIPSVIAIVSAALVLVHLGRAEGGFSSLDEVARLFSSRPVLLAGWLHYLAFDLAIGAWEVREARRRAVAPCPSPSCCRAWPRPSWWARRVFCCSWR